MSPAASPTGFALRQILDRRHHGVVAAAFDAPSDWHFLSDVTWNMEHVSFPVTLRAQVYNPQGTELFEFLPAEALVWVEPNYGMISPGELTLGQTCVRPMPTTDALVNWMVPKFIGRRPDLRILGAGPVPGLEREIRADLKGRRSEGASVRVTYSEHGRLFEEEMFGLRVQDEVPSHGPMGTMVQVNWGFTGAFRYRAEAGALDGQRGLFWQIARSFQMNPNWERLREQIQQQLQVRFDHYIQMGYQQIQAAGQLSQAISAQNDAMLASFEQQRQAEAASSAAQRAQSSERGASDGFSDYIRGVESMNDPYWGESQQDSNFRYHWTDGFGNYQHSNDPFFNPNIGGSQNWSLMDRKQ